jgi:TP901 family phage tail tape measure protein
MSSGRAIRAGAAYVELFTENSRFVRGLRLAENRLKAFGRRASQIGKQMLLVSAVMATPLAMATRTFANFEDQMLSVRAVTGAVGQEFDRLNEQAKQLGRTTSFTAAEVAGGMLSLGRAGFDSSEIEAAIPGVLNLARATGTDLAQSADIAAGTLRAFALDASQMGRVTDVLVATANNSAQTLEDLGESMKYVAPIAEEYGLSLEQTAKAVGALANMQIKGSMAGTSMRQIMLRLADPAVQKQLRAAGVEALDAAGNLRPVGNILTELGRAMQGMTNAERISLGKDLFDQRAAGAALKLAKSDFPALSDAIDNAGGVAEKTAKTMDSGLGGSFRRLMSALEGIQIAVGEALGGALSGVMDKLATFSVWIAEIITANKEWAVAVAGTIAAIAAVGGALVAIGLAGTVAATVFGGIATIVSAVGTAFGIVASVIGALLTPVGLVSAAIIGLSAYLIYASGSGGKAIEWLGEKFTELKETASQVFKGISDALAAGDIALAGKILWLSLKVEWTKGVNALREIWIGFKDIFMSAWTDAVFGLAKIFTRGVAMLETIWTQFSSTVVSKWKTAEQTLAEGIAYVIAKVQGLDPEEVIGNVRQDYGRQQQARDQATQARLQQIDSQREGALGVLEEDRKRAHADRQAGYGQQMSEQQRELNDLIRQRDEAIKAAEQAAAQTGTADGPAGLKQQIEDSLSGLDLPSMVAGGEAAGTFSAFAATRMDAGSAAERAAKAAEETAENTKRLLQEAKLGGAVFG